MVLAQMKQKVTKNQMTKKILSLLILFSFSHPLELQSKPKGRTYAPEEGTFDRRKRIVIERKCRLIKEFIEKKTYVIKRYRLKIIWRDALHKKTYESFYIPKNI